MNGLYFDSASTTPIDPEVVAEMTAALQSLLGNPSAAAHGYGQVAARRIASCRELIADAFVCEPDEVIFTSGATESDNLALMGIARAHAERGRHLVISAIEHRAVLACADQLEREGFEITRVRPDAHGVVQPEAIAAALRPQTLLVSVMHTNNETGVLQPLYSTFRVSFDRTHHIEQVEQAARLIIEAVQRIQDLMQTKTDG